MTSNNKNLQARNNIIVNAPAEKIYSIITDITMLPKVNPGVINVSGKMDEVGGIRLCTIDNKGKEGQMEERCLELVNNQKTVWKLESDTVGFSKMMKDITFTFILSPIDSTTTSVTNETIYIPKNILARIMNALFMKGMISKTQQAILVNLKSLAESK